jgi:hypothetical protein
MKIRSIVGAVASRLTPWPTLKRQGKDVIGSVQRTAERIQEFKRLASRPQVGQADGLQLTPEQRFQKLYEDGAWTETELQVRAGRLRVTKLVWLAMSLALLIATVALALAWPFWQSLMLLPIMLFMGLICFGKTVVGAWYEYQIYSRSMVTFAAFAGRPEFFRFLLT